MTMHCDVHVYIHDRSCACSGFSTLHDLLLDFLKGRSMEKIGARSLYPHSCCVFCKCFHSVIDYPVPDCPVVLSFELMGIVLSQDE